MRRDSAALLPGTSPRWNALRAQLRRAAACGLPVLVCGESGSGKEGVVRALHGWSRVARGPFLALNCAALQEQLLEAELFGAVRGAYTGCDRDRPGMVAEADGGTLFLDEIGEMSLPLQAKLLRLLDGAPVRALGGGRERDVRVRWVAATHRDLDAAVREGRFRADLWWRLAMIRVEVPALRERLDDLPALVDALAPALERECARGPLRLTAAALERLRRHDWPGNVRELRAVLARALLSAPRLPIGARWIEPQGTRPRAREEREEEAAPGLEERMIRVALSHSAGTVAGAAARIGWTRQKLYRRMAALGIRPGTTSSASSTFQ